MAWRSKVNVRWLVMTVRWCGEMPVGDGAERVVDWVGVRADSFFKDTA